MCVFLCANSSVREWLDMPLARAYRQSLQHCLICYGNSAVNASHENPAAESLATGTFELDEAARRRVMKRSSWLQAYCRYRTCLTQHGIHRVDSGELSRDWQKALETIAKTWGRLLSLVGLRW
jgi:hypothetical protein